MTVYALMVVLCGGLHMHEACIKQGLESTSNNVQSQRNASIKSNDARPTTVHDHHIVSMANDTCAKH